MAKQSVNIGTTANDGTGSPLRTAFDFINDNTDELYNLLGDGTDLSITGDVSISAGAVTIADDAVTGAKIADNVALAGSPTTTTQTAGDNSTKIATTAYADTAVANAIDAAPAALDTLNELAASLNDDADFAGTMTTALAGKLSTANGAVGTANLAADAVDGTKIADDAIDSEHIAADSIDAEHYAAGSVDTTALGADSVTNAKIADDSIDSEHYVDGSIDTAHLANDSVTHDKLEARYTAKQDISTTSGTINLDASSYGIFEFTSDLTGSTTLNIQNIKKGQIIDILISGSQTITFSADFTTETFNKLAEVDYDGANDNHIQVICIDDNDSDAILNYSVASYASDTTP